MALALSLSVPTKAVVAFWCEYGPSLFAQKLTVRYGEEYYLLFVLFCSPVNHLGSLPRNVGCVAAERLASLCTCSVVSSASFFSFFCQKKLFLLGHCWYTQGLMKALPQSRGRGIIITIKTIEAAGMSCLLHSMLNSLARGQAA